MIRFTETRLGEWWYTDHGDLLFADGNVGDMNHESHVMEHAQMLIADMMGFSHDGIDQPLFVERVINRVDPDNRESIPEAIRRWAGDNGAEADEILALWLPATDRDADLREFAIRTWGWTWICGDTIGIGSFNQEWLTRARKAIRAIEESEDRDIVADDFTVRVRVRLGNGRMRDMIMNWHELETGYGAEDVPQPAGISRHDEHMPAFYRQHIGD